MDKEQIQDQELEQVSGGSYCRAVCKKCFENFIPSESRHTLLVVGSGCHSKYYYICPACGYKWEK